MHFHNIDHVVLEWVAKKLGLYLLGRLLNPLKKAFLNSSFWGTVTASIFVLNFPFERMVTVMRNVAVCAH